VDLDILDVTIFDGHALRPESRVSIRDGLISEIGTGAAETPAARTITATGRLLTPGFVDAHVHTTFGGQESLACDLSRADGLDEVTANRPIILLSADHHSAWVNRAAMSLAGIDATTPDPQGGVIVRDESGEPTGCLHEAAIDLVGAHVPPADDAASRAGLRAGQSYLHRLGVTAWMDAIIGDYSGHRSPCDAYVAAEISTVTNELTVCDGRIVFDIAEGAPSTTATPNTAERPS
jgi:predicted amidohydrolase YtcJ